jgi:N-acetylmuramoyl-L-alanine amidase
MRATILGLVVSVSVLGGAPARGQQEDRSAHPPVRLVVIDPGHGGSQLGAVGPNGLQEKDLVLDIAVKLGAQLRLAGLKVVYTRDKDVFMSLPERAEIANRAKADLFVSLHANSSPDPTARGSETYFVSLEASDEDARRVAITENEVFRPVGGAADSGDIISKILGDLIRTEHLRGSADFAMAIQRELAQLPTPSRGVKQGPFFVLGGVNMPAVLLEVGFVSHPEDEQRFKTAQYQEMIARAITRGVMNVADERRKLRARAASAGATGAESSPQ